MPTRLAKAIDLLVIIFGLLFCLAWLLAFLAFPAFKHLYRGYLPVLVGFSLGSIFCLTSVRHYCNRYLDNIPIGRFLAEVGAVAFLLRALSIFLFPTEPQNDPAFFHRYAVNLLEGKGYGQAGWQAFFPPGMSFLLAGWYWLTMPTPVAGEWFNALIGTSWIFLVFAIGRRTIGERVGKWAALLTAIMPTLVFYSATLGYELVLGFIFLAIIYLSLLVVDSRGSAILVSIVLGLLIGFGSLIKPICLPIPALLVIWWLLMGLRMRSLLYGTTVVLAMVCVVAPWTLRNYHVFHQLVLISTNGGVVFYSANNAHTEGYYTAVDPLPGEVDEVSTDRLRSKAAVDWIKANPIRFLGLMVNKAMFTWGTATQVMSVISYDRLTPIQEQICMGLLNVFWGALLVQVLTATWFTPTWRERRLYVAFALLAYTFLIYVVSEAMSRHHIPVLGVLALIASAALARNGQNSTALALPDQPSRT